MATKNPVSLSVQEILDCDSGNMACDGGVVNKVYNFGMKKGFIESDCYEYEAKMKDCELDHYESNVCRAEEMFYRVQDYCIAISEENIKRELVKNGPVVVQM